MNETTNNENTITISGRVVGAPTRLIKVAGLSGDNELKLIKAEIKYYSTMNNNWWNGILGACLGGGFDNTNELHVMKDHEAMATAEKDKWKEAVKEEYDHMTKFKLFQAVPRNKVPEDAKVPPSTWEIKKMASNSG